MKPIRLNTAGHSSPSIFKTENPSPRPSNAPSVKHRTNTCTTTTAKNARSCFAKFAHRLFRPTIVLKERLKPNTSARTANMPYSAGKPFYTSLFTNAAMITALTALMPSINLTRRKNFYKNKIFSIQALLYLPRIFIPGGGTRSPRSDQTTRRH